jgi:hypothetical protein
VSKVDRQPRQFLGDFRPQGRPAENFRWYRFDSKVLLSQGGKKLFNRLSRETAE